MKKQLLTVSVVTMAVAAQAQISFTEISANTIQGVQNGSIAVADVDGDNDQDLLVTGNTGTGNLSPAVSKLYTNDGSGLYTEVMGTPFPAIFESSVGFADIDGDNDQDLLMTGYTAPGGANQITKLYTNNGSGVFAEVTGDPFSGATADKVMFFDMDGDNDQDVLFVETYNSKLFKNNGSGLFTEVAATAFQVEASPALAIADVDGDNDLDILITSFSFIDDVGLAKLYTNDGTGVFSEVLGTPFQGVVSGSIAFADIDGDNDQDVLISGGADLFGNSPIVKLYTNDGAGVFSEVLGTPFQGVESSSIAFADVDGDSDQDVLISGASPSAVISKLYSNDGSGIFTEVSGTPFLQSLGGAIAFVDVDGDDDPDAIITGDTGGAFVFSKVYRNQTAPADNECGGATDVNSLFGGVVNTPMTSSLYNHTGYTSEGTDPTAGFDCHFQGDPLQNTMWFSFDGDGNTYRIRTVDCSATNPHSDTQAALYSGDCNTLTPVLCNDDEDVNNSLFNVQVDLETMQGTTYYMLVDGYNGTEGEFCLEVTRQGTVNIFEADYQRVNVYPNPTEGVVSWNGITAQTAEVFDNTGRMVMNIAQPNGTVDISNLKEGIYIMVLHTEKGVYTSRVVKQ